MIHFKQITKYQSNILSNGQQIGTLELLANTIYLIEIDYFEFQLPVKEKRLVKGIIKRVHATNEKRKYKEIKRMVNFKPYNEYKIKE
jgi:hypothetical protein